MTGPSSNRKLAAILSADIVGYSRLMQADDEATVATLKEYRAAVARIIARHAGRVVNTPGDSVLAEFRSAQDAVRAAIDIQHDVEGRNRELADERQMHFRIGVNLGDVIEEDDGTLYGDGVNIAARMEALAEGGGICISSTVYDAIAGKLGLGFDFLGEQQVKNIAQPVRVYRVRAEPRTTEAKSAETKRRWPLYAGVGGLAVAVLAVGLWLGPDSLMAPEPPAMSQPTVAGDPALAVPRGPSIAVLPFANLSGDPEQAYFADGITEEIITRLTQYKEFLVFARNTMFQYQGQPVDIVALGNSLGAQYIVEGSVRRAATSVRITAQLIDAGTGAHVWAESYDRALTAENILQVQDEIAHAIASRIADPYGEINLAETARSVRIGPRSMATYDCLLRYFAYSRILTVELHAVARDCLEIAVEDEPQSSEAWSALSIVYVDEMLGIGQRTELSSFERSRSAAAKAVEIAPASGRAHVAYARALHYTGDAIRARDEAEIAVSLSPNDTEVLGSAAEVLTHSGMFQRGYNLIMKIKNINPNHPEWMNWFVFFKYVSERNFEQALYWIERSGTPDWFWVLAHRGLMYCATGDIAKGKDLLRKAFEANPDLNDIFWAEIEMWHPHPDWYVVFGILFDDIAAKCGWEIPPRGSM